MERENCLICECHLVSWEDLHQIFQELKPGHDASIMLTQVEDFKKYRILGHGCGQCLKTWEYELQQLINEQNKSL
jgi:hypothetical protein